MFAEEGDAMRRFVAGIVVRGLQLGVLALGAAYLGRDPLLGWAGRFLVVSEVPQPADAIVVLSGSIPDRILEAVDLYQAGLAPRLILTKEGLLPGLEALRAKGGNLPEHHEMNLSVAAQLGVPSEAITLITTPAWSTLTEAHAIVGYLQAQGLKRVLLVTSKAHTRRARMTYRPLAAPDLEIIVCASRYDPFDPHTWWRRRPYVRRVVIEYIKLVNYLLFDRWRAS